MKSIDEFKQSVIDEFKIAGWIDDDGVATHYDHIGKAAMIPIINELIQYEHLFYGKSLYDLMGILRRIQGQLPITPLTGDDSEWIEINEYILQNKRYAGIFKDSRINNGKAYDLNEPGHAFDNKFFIEFPYTPQPKCGKVFYEGKVFVNDLGQLVSRES